MSIIEQQEKMMKLGGTLLTPTTNVATEKPNTLLQTLGLSSKRIAPSSPTLLDKKNDPPNMYDGTNTNNATRKSVLFDGNGRFATKRRMSSLALLNDANENQNTSGNRRGSMHNRLSNINGPLLLKAQEAVTEVCPIHTYLSSLFIITNIRIQIRLIEFVAESFMQEMEAKKRVLWKTKRVCLVVKNQKPEKSFEIK